MRSKLFYIAIILHSTLLLVLPTEALIKMSSDERCDHCQMVISSIHGWFSGKYPSRRQVIKKSMGTCKRYPKYKRRCILAVERNTDVFVEEVTKMPFDVQSACKNLKECQPAEDFESYEVDNEIDSSF